MRISETHLGRVAAGRRNHFSLSISLVLAGQFGFVRMSKSPYIRNFGLYSKARKGRDIMDNGEMGSVCLKLLCMSDVMSARDFQVRHQALSVRLHQKLSLILFGIPNDQPCVDHVVILTGRGTIALFTFDTYESLVKCELQRTVRIYFITM